MRHVGATQVTLVEHASDSETQLGQIFPTPTRTHSARVLSANIFFAPRSFGGATVVAEQMTRWMVETSPFQQFIFTSLPVTDAEPYHLYRYEAHRAAVLGMGLPEQRSAHDDFENTATLRAFDAVLKSVAPDLVHLHSIQGFGALLAESCHKAGIPFVVTLHDAWWICGRQFMINNHGQYCGQTTIRSEVCAKCVDDAPLNEYRQQFLASTLKKASLLLAPSRFAKDLYIANGFDASKIRVNQNGILAPGANFQRHPGQRLRFGFVGGNTTLKGIELITSAFASIERSDYELKLVDNLMHLGLRSFNRHSVQIPGTVTILPGYTQANIDEFFSGIDVLLFPTQWKETFGLAVREALVRDVWVITTNAGGTVEDIVDGVNGTIIPLSADPKYLSQALSDVLGNQARYLQHRNTFKRSITLCSDQALELQGFYEEVLKVVAPKGSARSAKNGVK
ncbi:glycosyltransferase family 4 protein [Pseudomonas putida]